MENQKLANTHDQKCRICNSSLIKLLDFGRQPLGNGFLNRVDFKEEYFYQMEIGYSNTSKMVQLIKQPEPEKMFHDEYAFFSSTSKNMSRHFEEFAESVIQSEYIDKKSPFVIELGCNDGILLKHFSSRGIKHLGIEPSENVAKEANKHDVNTVCEFFSENLADKILKEYGKVDSFLAANVMCHIPNLNDVVKGIKKLIKPKGVVVFEDPYLGDVIDKTSYDQVYDEHVFLFSALSISYLFGLHDMELIDVQPQNTHGGSMRYTLALKGSYPVNSRVENLIEKEKSQGLDDLGKLQKFSENVEKSKLDLITLLKDLKKQNKTIAGYAATSKSTTIFNYCSIDENLIDYICDTTPIKQGKFSPGMHIPVVSHSEFIKNPPDYAILLAWNHAKEIMQNEKEFTKLGGKWITHVPKVQIIE